MIPSTSRQHPPQQPTPPWHSITSWIGRAWKQITQLPQKFRDLAERVCSIWDESPKPTSHFPLSPPTTKPLKQQPSNLSHSQKEIIHLPVITSVDNTTSPTKSHPSSPFEEAPPHSDADHSPPIPNQTSEVETRTYAKSEKKEIHKDFRSIFLSNNLDEEHPFISSDIPPSNQSSNSDNEPDSLQEAEMNSPPITTLNAIPSPNLEDDKHTIDVPDKGDCLFCAIGVGIKLLYNESIAIQSTLNWAIDPDLLKRNLRSEEILLAEPSKHLRQQAADFLEKNRYDPTIMVSLMASLIDHNEIAEKKIQQEQVVTVILEDDIEVLKERLNSYKSSTQKEAYYSIITQMTAKRSQLHQIQSSIEKQRRNIILEDNLESYLSHSREEGFYCGTAQIFALSHIYHIPIEVIFDYSKETEHRETFNPTESTAPKLTLAFINNNHFKFYRE